jgi:uroporphyrinogen-III synthase
MQVFISRVLSLDSVFKQILEVANLGVFGESLIDIRPIAFDAMPESEWIFFSSKNGVKFFFSQIKNIPTQVKWAAIGPGTASELAKFVTTIDFTGNGDPETSAQDFATLCTNQRVLFPSAKHSRAGVQSFLPKQITCIQLAVYHNQPVSMPLERKEDVLVFTSPMNAEGYFSKYALQAHQQVIAIGRSTFYTLQLFGIERLIMAEESTEEAMANAVLSLCR